MKVSDLDGKVVFWDIDGTLAEFRFLDKCWPCPDSSGALTQEVADMGVFLNREPIKHIRRLITASKAERHVILGRVVFDGEIAQKEEWLEKYYPEMSGAHLWVSKKERKGDVLRAFTAEFNIPAEKVVYIDDDLNELAYAESVYCVRCYHISSLLDWEED